MKTLSGTFAFVVLAVIAIVTLPSCCRKQVTDEDLADQKFFLRFGKPAEEDYVDVKQPDFDNALCALKANKGSFTVKYKKDANASPTPGYTPSCTPPVSINTDKITTSGVARTEPLDDSSAYDPKATHRVQSDNLADIKRVLDTFETPTPAPTP
jgi:hypothetical protein